MKSLSRFVIAFAFWGFYCGLYSGICSSRQQRTSVARTSTARGVQAAPRLTGMQQVITVASTVKKLGGTAPRTTGVQHSTDAQQYAREVVYALQGFAAAVGQSTGGDKQVTATVQSRGMDKEVQNQIKQQQHVDQSNGAAGGVDSAVCSRQLSGSAVGNGQIVISRELGSPRSRSVHSRSASLILADYGVDSTVANQEFGRRFEDSQLNTPRKIAFSRTQQEQMQSN